MRRISASLARQVFPEIVNKAYYANETTIVTRRGKDLAAVVPMSVVTSDTSVPSKKLSRPTQSRKKNPE